MRNPIPVTTRSITADSGSRTYDQSMVSPGAPPAGAGPISIQVQAVCDTRWSGADDSAVTAPSDTRNAASTVPHAMTPTIRFDSRAHRSPHTTNPANGSSGMSQRRSVIGSGASPFQEADVVHVDAVAVAEHRQDHGQAHGDLACGHGDGEDGEDLAVDGVQLPAESDEVQVGRVHHQLDRHQDDDGVAARQDSHDADREEEQADDEDLARRHRHVSLPMSSAGAPGRWRRSSRPAAGRTRSRTAGART